MVPVSDKLCLLWIGPGHCNCVDWVNCDLPLFPHRYFPRTLLATCFSVSLTHS